VVVVVPIILAAFLYVSVQNIADSSTSEVTTMGVNIRKFNSTSYVVTVVSGQMLRADANAKVLSPTGANGTGYWLTFNNLNANAYVDAGDSFSIGKAGGLKDHTFQIKVGSTVAVSQTISE